ncbi:transposase InsO family protein [Amycolatopsis thermophila]|uniref:Transposase InsO family protein n=1 Tax=Amycolatopsis thermophila TaxID=206084 RepID=A0ABU0EYL3_9PSEU|nr:transposase InsO family protein [Amycolatopsis thermophila]
MSRNSAASPDGGRHKVLGRAQGQENQVRTSGGYLCLRTTLGDRSRLADTEILRDEKAATCAALLRRAHAWFTRPWRRQTNGRVERLHRTLLDQWAYHQPHTSEAHRQHAFRGWLDRYNHHRPRTAIGDNTPASRATNLIDNTARPQTAGHSRGIGRTGRTDAGPPR